MRLVTHWFKQLLLITAVIAFPARAAGTYDGIWQISGAANNLYMLSQNGQAFIAMSLTLSSQYWEAFYGTITGSTGTVSTLVSDETLQGTFNFSSATAGTLTINSCTKHTGSCLLPAGSTVSLTKIF